jgi:hypothetical protein
MPRPRNSILEAITNPTKNFLVAFLIGTLLLNLVSDGVSHLFWGSFSDWLQTVLNIRSKAQLQGYVLLGLVAIVLLLIYGTNLAQGVRSLLVRWRVLGTEIPDHAIVVPLERIAPGLIVLMSTRENSPAEVAVRHHWNQGNPPHLRHCWVICTDSSLDYARRMKQRLLDDGLDEHQVQLYYGSYELADPKQPGLTLTVSDRASDDPDTVLNLINAIFLDAAEKGLDETDILVDFTGGTKPMGIGAVLACAAPTRQLQYLVQTDPPQLMQVQVSYKVKPARSAGK